MKDAMGELNMTVVTIVAIGAVAAFFTMVLWPQIRTRISEGWDIDDNTGTGNFDGEVTPGSIVLPDYFDIPNIYE